jgi:hypothetical protein
MISDMYSIGSHILGMIIDGILRVDATSLASFLIWFVGHKLCKDTIVSSNQSPIVYGEVNPTVFISWLT